MLSRNFQNSFTLRYRQALAALRIICDMWGILRACAVLIVAALACAQEKVDLEAVHRIRQEAFGNSKVMETAFYISDVFGGRYTGSPALRKSAEWAMKRMAEFGISDPHLEPWGIVFGRSWTNKRFSAHLLEPSYAPIIGVARPHARSTNGVIRGEPVLAPLRTEADLPQYHGKLRGRIVFIDEPRALQVQAKPLFSRFGPDDLARIEAGPELGAKVGPYDPSARNKFRNALNTFLNEEGAAATVTASFKIGRSDLGALVDGGTIFSTYAGARRLDEPTAPPAAAIATEHYNRIARLLEHKIPVQVEFEILNDLSESAVDSFSVIGEIPGSSRKDEIVILGGHLDSHMFGTGATDNAAGVAVVLEAARILRQLNLKLARTVRIGLWTGEEQGFGALPYVQKFLANKETGAVLPAHAKVSGYFNFDDGTGKIRGVYMQNNDMMRPIFSAWFAPFRDLGVTTLTVAGEYGSDQVPFDEAGIPAFQFIQDPMEYETRTHHSSMDVYDRLQPGDLMQSAAVLASVVYHAANRDEMLPRKPMPKEFSKRGGAK
jgi:hypothetical protein